MQTSTFAGRVEQRSVTSAADDKSIRNSNGAVTSARKRPHSTTPARPTRLLYILTSDTRDFLKLFLWQAERGRRPTRRHPRDDPCDAVGEDVGVGVVECDLNVTCISIN